MQDTINALLKELSITDCTLHTHTRLREELGLHSLKLVDLLVMLEETFHIVFDESDLDADRLISVGDIYLLTGQYLSE